MLSFGSIQETFGSNDGYYISFQQVMNSLVLQRLKLVNKLEIDSKSVHIVTGLLYCSIKLRRSGNAGKVF